MVDYLVEIGKAKRAYTKAWTTFSDKLDEWEDEHENMGEFVIGLHFKDKKKVYIKFHETKVNMDIVNKACEDFNLQVMHKRTLENYFAGTKSVEFELRHKDYPFAIPEDLLE